MMDLIRNNRGGVKVCNEGCTYTKSVQTCQQSDGNVPSVEVNRVKGQNT